MFAGRDLYGTALEGSPSTRAPCLRTRLRLVAARRGLRPIQQVRLTMVSHDCFIARTANLRISAESRFRQKRCTVQDNMNTVNTAHIGQIFDLHLDNLHIDNLLIDRLDPIVAIKRC